MKPAFFPCYAGGPSVQYVAVFAILIASLSFFLSVRSAKQFQRLHLNQGGLHNHLYMALNLDIALFLCVYDLYRELAVKYQPTPVL